MTPNSHSSARRASVNFYFRYFYFNSRDRLRQKKKESAGSLKREAKNKMYQYLGYSSWSNGNFQMAFSEDSMFTMVFFRGNGLLSRVEKWSCFIMLV